MKSVFKFFTGTFKREIAIVLTVLTLILALPALSVVVLASSGFSAASEVLAAVNPITHLVDIFGPNGEKVAEVELSTVWPIQGEVTDEFGTKAKWRQLLGLGGHTGIDISNGIDTPVTPFTEGTVLTVDNIDDSACGKSIKLDHGSNVASQYCHLNSAVEYPFGTPVGPGDVIGYVGNTGTSTGPHLHFMIYVYGIPVNPRTFMVGEPSGS